MASNITETAKTALAEKDAGREAVDALVRRAQAGDAEAFSALVRAFSEPMFNLAYRMTGNHADAADLTQEIFVKLHRSIGKFRWKSGFATWLYALAANTCRSGLRRFRRISSREVVHLDRTEEDQPVREPRDPGDSPVRMVERKETGEAIQAAINTLPEDFRIVIVLRDLQGLAYEEIAGVLQCAPGTVKSRLARARLRVKEKLVREGLVCAAKTPTH